MPIFFFDMRTRRRLEPDESGLELASAEAAYLAACAAIPGLAAELLRRGDQARRYAFVVMNEAGHLLWKIPFLEILDRKRGSHARRPRSRR